METGDGHPEKIQIGRDQVTITEGFVTIDSLHEMPDWQVREFQRLAIFVGDFKFFLRQRIQGHPPFAMRYLLERWPEDAHFDAAPLSYTYDEAYVNERDAEHIRQKHLDKLSGILTCFYPLLGFLWADTKQKLIPAGFVPRTITSISIFTSLCFVLLQGTFIRMQLGLFTLLLGKISKIEVPLLTADYALLALVGLDMILRFDQHLKRVSNPWGFGEWITKPFRRRPAEEEEHF